MGKGRNWCYQKGSRSWRILREKKEEEKVKGGSTSDGVLIFARCILIFDNTRLEINLQ